MDLTVFFLKILSMSLTASYCILFICIARLFLRRAPKVFSYLLWSIVAVRLLCPVAFESRFSLVGERLLAFTDRLEADKQLPQSQPSEMTGSGSFGAENSSSPENQVTGYHNTETPHADIRFANGSGINDANTLSNAANTGDTDSSSTFGSEAGARSTYSVTSPGATVFNGADSAGTAPGGTTGNAVDNDAANQSTAGSQARNPFISVFARTIPGNMLTAAACVWLAGMFGLFGYCIFSYLRLHCRLKEKAAYSHHYRGIPVYTVAGLDTPFVAGFTKPAIYLPAELEEWETSPCLAHEYTHIRRKDYLIKQFAFLLTCVYWFQPLVWLAFHLMSRDMEMSCDEMTLRNADLQDRKTYSNALVRLSSETHRISGCPLAFSENNTSFRIRNILNRKKFTMRKQIICSLLLSALAAGLLANPVRSSAHTGGSAESFSEADNDILYDPPLAIFTESSSGKDSLSSNSLASGKPAADGGANAGGEPASAADDTEEDPYHTYIQNAYQELQAAYQASDTERAAELRREMKDAMTSYWTKLVGEQRAAQNELDRILNSNTGSKDSEEKTEAMQDQVSLLANMATQAKTEMNYVDKTIDAIEGSVNVVKNTDCETAYPLHGTLSENGVIVRSLPKDSAPAVDTLAAGDVVSIISFGKYMLQEDPNLRDFFLSDTEIRQEYQNFAAVLYQSNEDEGRTTRKGYINIDAPEISGNTVETYKYWIGKAWCEAFCSRDGSALYQMAADKKSFMEWEYVNSVRDTDTVQVEFSASCSYPQHFYQVTLLTEKDSENLISAGTDDIALQYFVQTSEPGIWTQRQNLQIAGASRQLQNVRHISDLLNNAVFFSEIRNYERITSSSEYQDACLTACESGPRYFDFKGSGYTALYHSGGLSDPILSAYSSEALETLTEKYLNLSGGSGEANILTLRARDNGRTAGLVQLAYVEYSFSGSDENGPDKISIPMYYDKEGYWCIWTPGQDESIDEAIYGVLESFPIKAFE